MMNTNNTYFENLKRIGHEFEAARVERKARKQQIIDTYGWESAELKAWYAEDNAAVFPFSDGACKAYRAWCTSLLRQQDELELDDFLWDKEVQGFVDAPGFPGHAGDGDTHPVHERHTDEQGNPSGQVQQEEDQGRDSRGQQDRRCGQDHGAFPQVAAAAAEPLFHKGNEFPDQPHRMVQPFRVAQEQVQDISGKQSQNSEFNHPGPLSRFQRLLVLHFRG